DLQHHFVCATADGGQAPVPEHARYRAFLDVAHAAPELQAAIGNLTYQPACLEFGHGGDLRGVFSAHHHLHALPAECPDGFDLGLQLGQRVMNPLVVQDGATEGLAFPGVVDGHRDGPVRHGAGVQGAPQSLDLELLHLVDEAHALVADAIAYRHAHVIEVQLRRIGRMHAHLADLARHAHSFGLHGHHDQGLVAVRRAVRGIGQHTAEIRLRAVGRPHLAAIDDVVVAIPSRRRLDGCDVRAAAHFGYTQAPDVLAADRRGQELA